MNIIALRREGEENVEVSRFPVKKISPWELHRPRHTTEDDMRFHRELAEASAVGSVIWSAWGHYFD